MMIEAVTMMIVVFMFPVQERKWGRYVICRWV